MNKEQMKRKHYIFLAFGIWIMVWGIFTVAMLGGVVENVFYNEELNFSEMLDKQQEAIKFQQSALCGFMMMCVGYIPMRLWY